MPRVSEQAEGGSRNTPYPQPLFGGASNDGDIGKVAAWPLSKFAADAPPDSGRYRPVPVGRLSQQLDPWVSARGSFYVTDLLIRSPADESSYRFSPDAEPNDLNGLEISSI